jgi:hypothetical protein
MFSRRIRSDPREVALRSILYTQPRISNFARSLEKEENSRSLFIEPMTENPLDMENKNEYPEKTKKK